MLTLDEFVILAYRVRQAQRAYFRRRDPGLLEESKKLERELDEAIKQHTAKQPTFNFGDDQ